MIDNILAAVPKMNSCDGDGGDDGGGEVFDEPQVRAHPSKWNVHDVLPSLHWCMNGIWPPLDHEEVPPQGSLVVLHCPSYCYRSH
ncbi:hypothetical protein E2C01_032622 [Portunus trituberculatus]|uniref:Uncharacterized protein n=1 Tax=Portunus trituberculatus TaxID=210409 RepID=A0A5B7EWG2_PORTR|nr:hypothetical protein [Portunus trituberculatus]